MLFRVSKVWMKSLRLPLFSFIYCVNASDVNVFISMARGEVKKIDDILTHIFRGDYCRWIANINQKPFIAFINFLCAHSIGGLNFKLIESLGFK